MATIIKGNAQAYASGTPLRKMSFDFKDLSNQGEQYLAQVRSEAAKIVQRAQTEASQIRAQAEQAGRKAAEREIERILEEKVARQMQSLKPAIESSVQQILDAKADWERHWERHLIRISCAIAARIVRREIRDEPEIPLTWIHETLELATSTGEMTLYLNPQDLETLRNQVESLAASASPTRPARIVGDDSITLGGCRVETQFGSVDHQLETQLERIAAELAD